MPIVPKSEMPPPVEARAVSRVSTKKLIDDGKIIPVMREIANDFVAQGHPGWDVRDGVYFLHNPLRRFRIRAPYANEFSAIAQGLVVCSRIEFGGLTFGQVRRFFEAARCESCDSDDAIAAFLIGRNVAFNAGETAE